MLENIYKLKKLLLYKEIKEAKEEKKLDGGWILTQ